MRAVEEIRELLGNPDLFVDRGGVHWFSTSKLTPPEMARSMKSIQARFITITATELVQGSGLTFEYLWDLEGQMLGFSFTRTEAAIESIFDICEAADWIEREIHEGFAVDFLGRECAPLLLRDGNRLGVNLREEVK